MSFSPASDAPSGSALPTIDDVRAAAKRLAGQAVETPLLRSDALDMALGARVLIKAEPLQRTGSFKFRGAYHCISRIGPAAREGGVVAYSSGNHAQAVAAAARLLGVPAAIVMPRDAPAIKIAGTRRHGAEVILYDRARESREEIAAEIVRVRGSALVKPFDDPDVIAGQGTAGLEIVAQCRALGCTPDLVVVPASGGGLTAGIALAIADAFPETAIYTVEPEGFDDHVRSLAAGRRLRVADPARTTLADALMVPEPGALTFAINKALVRGGVAVSDDAMLDAMAAAFTHLKIVAEPGGAVALAAVLNGIVDVADKTVVAVVSGGNVDPAVFRMALERADDVDR